MEGRTSTRRRLIHRAVSAYQITLVIMLLSVSTSLMGWGQEASPPHVIAATRVQKAVIKAIEDAGFELRGSGGCMMMEVSELYFLFQIRAYASVAEARELVLAAREACLKIGKEDEDFQQYLDQAPFCDRHISLDFSFKTSTSPIGPRGYVSGVVTTGTRLVYFSDLSIRVPSRVLHMETLDEAKSRVKGLSLKEVVQGLPKMPQEAGPPIWDSENYYSRTVSMEDAATRWFSNPIFSGKG